MDTLVDGAKKAASSTSAKMTVVGALILICFIGSLFVKAVVSDRSMRNQQVEAEISNSWGKPQLVAGPVITVPVEQRYYSANGTSISNKTLYILPSDLNITSELNPEKRSRGIYEATVYEGTATISGTFKPSDISGHIGANDVVRWDQAEIAFGLTDTRGVHESLALSWNNKPVSFLPGSNSFSVEGSGVHAKIDYNRSAPNIFSFEVAFNGSGGIQFVPVGDSTTVSVSAPWGSPSFVGAYLPSEETLTEDSFSATWEISSFGRSFESVWLADKNNPVILQSDGYRFLRNDHSVVPYFGDGTSMRGSNNFSDSTFGVSLFRDVTFYTLVDRTVKYAILFIVLTFLAFFLFEIRSGLRVHPFQYLLVGFALVLFYLLLLAFAEHIGFGSAYIVSALMTIGLISWYSASVLKAKSRAQGVAMVLIALYAYLYIVLQLEELALLFGTLLLFVVLAVVMRFTRSIDWYKTAGQ